MARTLSAAVAAAVARESGVIRHLLSFTVGATPYRFSEDAISHGGNDYEPHLLLDGFEARYTQTLRSDPATVRLQNVSKEMAAVLKTEDLDILGVEVTLQRLFLLANEAVTIYVGRIAEVTVDENAVALALRADLDPNAVRVPKRQYSALHSTDGATFEDMSGTPHLFDGFLHVTRELTDSIGEPIPPPADGYFGGYGNDWD